MADGTYIIDLAFGTWQNRIWLCDKEEADSADRRWTDAKQSLEEVGELCTACWADGENRKASWQ